MGAVVKGAKGGSKNQRTPKIANDTAASKTFVRILYGMSEGEVEGLANGLNSIYLEDTPIESESGAKNFNDVTLGFRTGTNDQEHIEGFEDISSEVAVGVELKDSAPWVKAISNISIDAVNIRLKWDALREQNAQNGDVSGITIEYAIDVQTDGGTWETMLETKISDKTSANYERQHRVGLPKADRGWQIRVRRITPNSTSEYVSDKMYVQALTEVVDLKLGYPNTALIGIQYDAETFSNIAKLAVDLKGIRIRVPSNYDPITRKYNGFWDGTFKRAYSNNPAWIYHDICIEKRYALGDRLTVDMIDKWTLYRLAQYCDQMVPDGKGSEEPRFTCNIYIQSAEDAYSILLKLAGVFRAISFWDGSSIVVDADLPQDTFFTYTRANVIDGHFEYGGTRARDRHSVSKVAWDNPKNRYKTEYVYVRDEAAIAKLGVRIVEIDAWGCTSEGQAQRAGLWALKSEQLETRTVSFKIGLDGHIPQPGRVIEVADPLFAGRANGGRIAEVSKDLKSITVDRDEVVCRPGDRLVVNGEDGQAQARIVSSMKGRVITVVSAFESVAAQNVWVVDAKDLATMKFRVISITQDEQHQFSINALQYNPAKFDAIDHGAFIDDRPISIINPNIQDPVESVTITSESRVDQGLNIATMIISFPQVEGATKYQVEWRKDNGTWLKLPVTGSNSAEVPGIYAGKYEARVIAISAFNISSLPTYSKLTELKGKQGKPPKLAFIRATGVLFGMKLDWGFPATGAFDTAYVEINVSPDGKSNIAQLGLFAYPTTTHTIQGLQSNLKQFYQGRIVDRIGNKGDWSNWVSGTSTADAKDVLDLLHEQISESQLNKDLQEKIEKIGDVDFTEINQKIDDVSNAVNNLDEGLTQEIADRTEGDEKLHSELNAYKLSNDTSVSAITESITQIVDDQSVMSQRVETVFAQTAANTGLILEEQLVRASEGEALSQKIDTVASEFDSSLSLVKSDIKTVTDANEAMATRVDTVASEFEENKATVQQQINTIASENESTANTVNTLQTTVGENTASIQEQKQSIDGVYAQQYMKFDVNGHIVGHGSMNDGKTGTMIFNYDAVHFGAPVGVDGVQPKPLMSLQATSIVLPNGTTIPPGLYVSNGNFGQLDASKIWVEELSGIAASFGTLKVESVNIKDEAVDSSKIKKLSVDSGHIKDLSVDTLKIKDNAVTVSVAGENISSLRIETNGGPVRCNVGIELETDHIYSGRWVTPRVVVKRNGQVIRSYNLQNTGRYSQSSSGDDGPTVYLFATYCCELPMIVDYPPLGIHNYTVEVTAPHPTPIKKTSIALMEVKK